MTRTKHRTQQTLLTRPWLRILMVEDYFTRVRTIEEWLPGDVKLVVSSSAGSAMRTLELDRGAVYAGVLLDFDLDQRQHVRQEDPGTGADVARKMVTTLPRDVPVLVHSMNPESRQIAVSILRKAGFPVTQVPMSELTRDKFLEWLEEVREVHEARLGD